MTVASEQLGLLREPRHLVRLDRDVDVAPVLEVAVDPEPLDVGSHRLEVRQSEPLEHGDLIREAGEAVADPVGDRRRDEATVATARSTPDPVGLDEDDAASGRPRLRVDRRPEPREATPDDAELGVRGSLEPRPGPRRRPPVEPERPRNRISVGRSFRGARIGSGPGSRPRCISG